LDLRTSGPAGVALKATPAVNVRFVDIVV